MKTNAKIETVTRKEMREVEVTEEIVTLQMTKFEAEVLFGILGHCNGFQTSKVYMSLQSILPSTSVVLHKLRSKLSLIDVYGILGTQQTD